VHPRYAIRTDHKTGGKVVGYPPFDVRGTAFHRMAVSDLMYEMKTSPHVRLDKWRKNSDVPFLGDPSAPSSSPEKKKRRRNEGDGDAKSEGGESSAAAMATGTSDEAETGRSSAVEEDNIGGKSVDVKKRGKDRGEYGDKARYYELPDGTRIELKSKAGREFRRLPELYFTEEIPFVDLSGREAGRSKSGPASEWTLSSLPLQDLCRSALTAVGDSDARKELCGNVLLCGSASLHANFPERLSYELSETVPAAYKCRVVASRNSIERRCASWIGGSILTSLGSFQQLWLSRREYEELGAGLGVQRFP